MKRALVLAGGGSKGAYEVGFVKALRELNIDFQIVTGTSIGALNGCLLAQNDFDKMEQLWKKMSYSTVFEGDFNNDFSLDLDTILDQKNLVLSFFKGYIKEKGADITPLKSLIRGMLDEDKLLNSKIDYGLCTVKYPSLKPLFITKKEMEKEYIFDYLISSASCFPVFPIHKFHNESFIDGGYYDNVPIDLAFDMGADEVIVVDMHNTPTHEYYVNRPHVSYTCPKLDLGGFLDFSREALDRNMRIGYQTAMQYFGSYCGYKYAFIPFDTPLFHDFYKEVLYLERFMRNNNRLETTDLIYNKFLESHNQIPLLENDYLYIVLDWFMELLERDASYTYNYDLFVNDLLNEFSKYTNKDYKMFSLRTSDDITNTLHEVNKKGLIGQIYNNFIYPNNNFFDEDKYMRYMLKEYLMAKYLYMIYIEKNT